MYFQCWGLTEAPFSNSSDPRGYFDSPVHEEALARLMFVAEHQRRCGLLVGPAGSGKSLLLAVAERRLRRTQRETVLLELTGKTADECLWDLAAGLRLGPSRGARQADLWRSICDHLHGSEIGLLPAVILVDHLESATPDAHSALQRLLRLPSTSALCVLIAIDSDASLTQKFGTWADLRVEVDPLDRELTEQYIASRLQRAGARRALFTSAAIDSIYALTGGLPRDVNHLCELALVAASAFGDDQVDQGTVNAVAVELSALRGTGRSRLTKSA